MVVVERFIKLLLDVFFGYILFILWKKNQKIYILNCVVLLQSKNLSNNNNNNDDHNKLFFCFLIYWLNTNANVAMAAVISLSQIFSLRSLKTFSLLLKIKIVSHLMSITYRSWSVFRPQKKLFSMFKKSLIDKHKPFTKKNNYLRKR